MRLDLFKPRKPPLIGVDVSASAVKMVEIADAGRGLYRVERYAIEPLPKDAVSDGNISDPVVVGESVKRAWRKLGTRTRLVAMALPAGAVITKTLNLASGLSETEMEIQVESEAGHYIPFGLDEVNLDFHVLGPRAGVEDESEVLIAASRKEKVEDRLAVAQAAGLKAVVMDVETFAAQAAFELAHPGAGNAEDDQTVALADVGATTLHFQVFHRGRAVFTREQPFGGQQLSQEIQRRFGLTPDETEQAKRQGGLPEGYEAEVLMPFSENLGAEVMRALQFFFSSTPYTRVDHVFLAGGCAAIPGLAELVANHTRVAASLANPFVSMAVSPRVKPRQLAQDAPALLVACGLALRRFDA